MVVALKRVITFNWTERPKGQLERRGARVILASGHDEGFPAGYFCIKAFSETDQNEDLKKFDVPTLIIEGDDDQIVPFADAGLLQSKLIKGATLKVYKGAPHGLCTTLVNLRGRVKWPQCLRSSSYSEEIPR